LKSWVVDLPVVGESVRAQLVYPTAGDVRAWRQRGHEFGLHPYVEEGLEAGWKTYWQEFTSMGYGPVSPTTRTHRILWSGWADTARVQAQYGIRMNLDYYHYGPAFQKKDGEWVYGHFNASGLPMKFVDIDGQLLNIYQQNTQLVDEHMIKMPWGMGGSNVGGEKAAGIVGGILQMAVQKYPAAFAAQFHFDPFALGGDIALEAEKFLLGSLEHAVNFGVPIWNAENWLLFNENRSRVGLSDFVWNSDEKKWVVNLFAPGFNEAQYSLLIPVRFGSIHLAEILVDNLETSSITKSLFGLQYELITLSEGNHVLELIYH
jgi:hypothetical protein